MKWCVSHPQLFFMLAMLGVSSLGVWTVVSRSEAFAITEVQVPANVSLKVPESLIGQNLWSVDLSSLAALLNTQQPHLKRLRVIRRLPHTLQIEAVERTPLAQLKLSQWSPHPHSVRRTDDSPSANMQVGGWHLIDEEGFILPQGRPTPWEHLVMLKGMEGAEPPLRVGRENTDERVSSALRVVARLVRSSALAHRQVVAVDVSNPQHVTAWIRPALSESVQSTSQKKTALTPEQLEDADEEIEIRCGSEEELATQLERLRAVLQTVDSKSLAIRYIDVRFKDPVIGPRT